MPPISSDLMHILLTFYTDFMHILAHSSLDTLPMGFVSALVFLFKGARQKEKTTHNPSQCQDQKQTSTVVRWDFWTKLRKANFS